MKQRAFSLIELVLVIIIIAVISVIGYVAITGPQKALKLDSAAKKMAADIVYARNLAVSTSSWYGVSFQAGTVASCPKRSNLFASLAIAPAYAFDSPPTPTTTTVPTTTTTSLVTTTTTSTPTTTTTTTSSTTTTSTTTTTTLVGGTTTTMGGGATTTTTSTSSTTTPPPTTTTTTTTSTTTTLATTTTVTTTSTSSTTTLSTTTTTTGVTATTIALGANQYRVYHTDGASDTVIENPARAAADFLVDINELFGSVIISSVSIPGGGSQIEFNPLGIPYTDKNGVAISSEAIITLNYAGATKEIRITPNTGRVYVH